jgi:hypothetical protein
MTCWARTPTGVFFSIRTPALAAGAGGGAQLVATQVEVARAAASAALRRDRFGRDLLGVGPGNVHHDLELQ